MLLCHATESSCCSFKIQDSKALPVRTRLRTIWLNGSSGRANKFGMCHTRLRIDCTCQTRHTNSFSVSKPRLKIQRVMYFCILIMLICILSIASFRHYAIMRHPSSCGDYKCMHYFNGGYHKDVSIRDTILLLLGYSCACDVRVLQ